MSEAEIGYNKKYYEANKERIKAQMYKKEACCLCNRLVSHQQMAKHKVSKLCIRNRDPNLKYKYSSEELEGMLNHLEAKVKMLEDKLRA